MIVIGFLMGMMLAGALIHQTGHQNGNSLTLKGAGTAIFLPALFGLIGLMIDNEFLLS